MNAFTGTAERFSKWYVQIGSLLPLLAVRQGFVYIIPLVLIGSFALVLGSLPLPAYQAAMERWFGESWHSWLLYIRDGTFGMMSLVTVLGISYSYAQQHGERYGYRTSPIAASLVSLGSFAAVLGLSKAEFQLADFGVLGVFLAIFVAVTSSMLFMKLLSLRMFQYRAFTDGANLAFNSAIISALPAAITIALYALAHLLLQFGEIGNVRSFISGLFIGVFARIESPELSAMLFIFLVHLFWLFGIHGSNVLEPVAQTIFVPALEMNQQAAAAGLAPEHIFTKTFFDAFVLIGGCGSALSLVLAILIAGVYKTGKKLAKLSFVPVMFNINELLVFGIPIVLNPIFLLPFLGVPLLMTFTSFLAVYWGLVPHTLSPVEWTTPVFLSGYTATASWSAVVLQLFNLILGTLVYIPFVRMSEKTAKVQVTNNLNKLYSTFKQGERRGTMAALLTRHDEVGITSRFLAAALQHDLRSNKLTLFYQPQVDHDGNVFGVEVLLRWNHQVYGYIYPPLVIALAEEAQMMDELGYWIIDTACADLNNMTSRGWDKLTMSINICSAQLESDRFIDELSAILHKHGVRPQQLEMEITEHVALTSSQKMFDQVLALKQLGVKLAMDDFGMGRSSLMYLKEYRFDTVKLDGSLVRELLVNSNCKEIISSIMYLSSSLQFAVIAEYVENAEQKEMLHRIGCSKYQGYLYSKAVPLEELLPFLAGAVYGTEAETASAVH